MAISSNTAPELTSSEGLFDLAMAGVTTIDEINPGSQPSPEHTGQIIGERYILRSLLGEGGAAQVWRAEQTEPVKREVAIKIVRPGLLTKPVAARFEREHQVLARMEHPHIAAVFDAGELPDGRTYFVMELVSGAAVTQWCKERKTPVRVRLEIFLQACMAVQHAHQRGILHRDLKPSNVMVVEVDDKPLVKVIDFGIAKALEGDLSAGKDATLCGMVLGTPRYMSPEQAELNSQDVDIRTDVYALGVLLYELLTGTTPILEHAGAEPPLPELLEQVRRSETEPPSQRVMRASNEGRKHPAQDKTLACELRGELDWITLRALQKTRELRYPTVLNLAEDVRHYLRDEPVSAGPPGVAYQIQKWLVRNRSAVSMAAAVAVSLTGGLAATWWALGREAVQRQEVQRQMLEARANADLARQVSAQLKDMLSNARKHANSGMNTQLLRKLADECADGMPRFAHQPQTEAQLAELLAMLYVALEEPARAQPWLLRRWELLKQTDGENSPAALRALYTLGWRAIELGEPAKAVSLLGEAQAGYEQLPVQNEAVRAQLQHVRRSLARALSRSGQHGAAVEQMAQVIQAMDDSNPAEKALWLRDQAEILKSAGQYGAAREVLQRAIKLLPAEDRYAGKRVYLLSLAADLGRKSEQYEAVLAASAEQLRVIEKQSTHEDPALLKALISHATAACKVEGCPGGEEAARRAVVIAQTAGHESRLADAWIALSETLRVKHRLGDSEKAIRSAIAEVSQTKAETWRVMELHRRLGDLLTSRRDFEHALQAYETAAAGWFAGPRAGRPPEKERLIFESILRFWEAAAKAKSPVANDAKWAEWLRNLQEWDAARTNGHTLP